MVSATGIEARVSYKDMQKNADICVLPLSDASLHLGDGENYQLLGVATHGNFFLISENQESVYTQENLQNLIGKKIGVVQLAKLPGLVFRSILERANIAFKVQSDVSQCDENVVNLVNIKPTDVKKGLGFDLYALPEPLKTAKINGAGFYAVGNMQEWYGGDNGYPQAVIVAKRSVFENNKVWLDSFVEKLNANQAWLQTASLETILNGINSHLETGLTPSLSEANLSKSVIEGCGVRYVSGYASKPEINTLIANLKRIDESAVKECSNEFFNENY